MKSDRLIAGWRLTRRELNILISVVAATAGLLLPAHVQAAGKANKSTTITTCPYVINAPGVYSLAQDLDCAGTAITILADNVTLNLGGHTISGKGAGEGIHVGRNANVTIQRGTVQWFETGIRLDGTLDGKVSNVTVRGSVYAGISCQGMGMTITGNICSGNGGGGIHLDVNARDNIVSHNTADLNGFAGIDVAVDAFANTIADNTTTQNGDGIFLCGAHRNTVIRNTVERNGVSGIDLLCDSTENLVEHNLLTANGDGLRVLNEATNNTLQNNTIMGSYHGIAALGSATGNIVQANEVILNIIGISVDAGARGNTFAGNTALENNDFDLFDENGSAPSCGNTWLDNTFKTTGGIGADCIQ